jgi:hypothetical protein
LKPGEVRTWTYALPDGNGVVHVRVGYKYFFLLPDSASDRIHEKRLDY